MSEQTPESTANPTDETGFSADDAEPSMEDILASIRKIISDDADPVALEGPGATSADHVAAPSVPAPALNATVEDTPVETDEFDIESLLGELDIPETLTATPSTLAQSGSLGEGTSFDDDLAIPEIEVESVAADQDDDDMDRLMNDILSDFDDVTAEPKIEAPVSAAMPTASAGDDMDVVKSLMADLTDEPIEPEAAVEGPDTFDMDTLMGDFDDVVATPVAAEISPTDDVSDADELDALEDDIFDSILEMTLDDEVDAFDAQTESDLSLPSLADIASAAESEAVAEPAAIVGVAAVAAAAVVTTQTVDDVEDDIAPADVTVQDLAAEIEVSSAQPEPAQPAPSEMETPMPSALRSDAILDDVTESATMSAFAELNQVVEDKAILSERGPRIGDLVQDALKPMLKEWLDENIQGIVERAVAKEVKRIATGK